MDGYKQPRKQVCVSAKERDVQRGMTDENEQFSFFEDTKKWNKMVRQFRNKRHDSQEGNEARKKLLSAWDRGSKASNYSHLAWPG